MLRNKEKGFTLIELLIVIGIIAILAAAVIIAINPGRQFTQARNATRWSHVNSIINSIYAYAIDHGGNFPTNCPGASAADVSTVCGALTPTYMQSLPEDPQDAYDYRIQLEGTRVKVWSNATEASGATPPVEVIK